MVYPTVCLNWMARMLLFPMPFYFPRGILPPCRIVMMYTLFFTLYFAFTKNTKRENLSSGMRVLGSVSAFSHLILAITASANASVPALPPRSRVSFVLSASSSTAL